MREIKEITISFENLEVITIPMTYIDFILLDSITKNFMGNCYNGILEYNLVKNLVIEINKDANKDNYFKTDYGDSPLPFERINGHKDIVAIDIIYSNEDEYELYVDWDGNEDYEYKNTYQKTVLNNEGNLVIVISNDDKYNEYLM